MSDLSHKQRLQEAVRRLEEWEKKLPGFGAFHAQRTAVLEQLRSQSGGIFGLAFANKQALDELLVQARTIDQLAVNLDDIFQKVSQLQTEVRELNPLLRAQDSAPFAASIEQRHKDWLAQLEPLGRDASRTSELKTPRQVIQDFQRLVPRDRVGLELLAEASSLVTEVDQEVGRIGLEGDLKRWRDEFLRNGAPHHWAEQLREEIDGYRKKREEQVRKVQNQPGRTDLAVLERESIPLATYWAHVLDEFRAATPPVDEDPAPGDTMRRLGHISERTRQSLQSKDLTAEVAAEIRGELDALLDQMASAAEVRSRTALRQLKKRLELFCETCETGPERDERIAALTASVTALDGRELTRPDDFEGFAAALDEAKTEFEGLAANQRGRLASAAKRAGEACGEIANRLLGGVHPQEIVQSLRALQLEIPAEHPGEPQAQESLRLLEICDRIRVQCAELERESAVAMERFQSRRSSVAELRAGAAAVLETLGEQPSDPFAFSGQGLESLVEPAGGVALESYEQELSVAQNFIVEALSAARAKAEGLLAERRQICLEGGRALEAIKRIPPTAPAWPDTLDDFEPQAIRELLEESASTEAVYRDELARAAEALRGQSEEAAEGLRSFIASVAESGDSKRLWAEDLLAEFEDSLWLDSVDPATQVLDAARWMEGLHTFQEDLRQNETRARELREQLRTLQLEIQKDSRHRYCPSLFERARRLLEGVPEEPSDWQQAVTQLGEAERALRLADGEARRRIALELRETRNALREAARNSSDVSVRREIDGKLAKLDEHPAEQTPPNAVRRPLIYQARQLGVGTLRGRR